MSGGFKTLKHLILLRAAIDNTLRQHNSYFVSSFSPFFFVVVTSLMRSPDDLVLKVKEGEMKEFCVSRILMFLMVGRHIFKTKCLGLFSKTFVFFRLRWFKCFLYFSFKKKTKGVASLKETGGNAKCV